MKLIYIAGRYRSNWIVLNWLGRLLNIRKARNVAKEVWKAGYYAFCPHMNSAMMDGITDDENFIKGTKEMLKHCDYILMVDGWGKSFGANEELIFAKENNIPVLFELDWKDILLMREEYEKEENINVNSH